MFGLKVSLRNQIEQLDKELQEERASQAEERQWVKKQVDKLHEELDIQKMESSMYKNCISDIKGHWIDVLFKPEEKKKFIELQKTMDGENNAWEEANTCISTKVRKKEVPNEKHHEYSSLLAQQKSIIAALQHQIADSEKKQMDFERAMTELQCNYKELQSEMQQFEEDSQASSSKILLEKACQTRHKSRRNSIRFKRTPSYSPKKLEDKYEEQAYRSEEILEERQITPHGAMKNNVQMAIQETVQDGVQGAVEGAVQGIVQRAIEGVFQDAVQEINEIQDTLQEIREIQESPLKKKHHHLRRFTGFLASRWNKTHTHTHSHTHTHTHTHTHNHMHASC